MPSYPASIYSRPDPIPASMSTTPTHSTILGQYGDEIESIEGTLGVNPQGTKASVSARIAAREPTIATYTPVLGGTGWALGAGTITGRYISVDGFVRFVAIATFGSGANFTGGAAPSLTFPINANAIENGLRHITVTFFDTSATLYYTGRGQIAGGLGAVNCLAQSVSGTVIVDTVPGTTSPFAWATGDQIIAAGTYMT